MNASATACGCPVPIEIAGTTLGRHRHICAFFRDAEEEYRVMVPFIKDGLGRGDRICQIVESGQRPALRRHLQAGGVDVEADERSGQLEILSVHDHYVRDGHIDVERMLTAIRQRLSADDEPSISRITGHAEWAGADWPGMQTFLEYEARLNDVVPEGRDTVVCLYDLSKTSAALIADVLRTHPVVILGGLLHENPFYLPVDQFLRELHGRQEVQAQAR
ncbi:MEDS domain-containing protein [Ramlibacter ginsenosidimutans]|uniref:MEDS domain-containing protein n=1 Tax=Ramlibacter ginsenosidimutans TaxID=502333 RepID=A0A934TPY1_9BURK|nr:MEDS domain-containing protein [Ramlibacter ginsenosidimutans]MBK6004801.1 MEDS domain-containing protein [Ramlibacter ginsenosidimutans]